MPLVENLFLLCGAIALFLYALKLLAEGIGEIAGAGMAKVVRGATSNRFGAVIAGALCTAVAQSSVATNMIVVALVEKNAGQYFCADGAGVVLDALMHDAHGVDFVYNTAVDCVRKDGDDFVVNGGSVIKIQ